ncbi:zinc metalloprotease [Solirubrobacter phytolaccae]|uniref:Zinc metalloprotease n=1 Tax=Solirubrobacter phytolaccae TaxID=1404360 RepID=A0A9X3SF87_9ACTN|nr:zinc metalloprotease [Solirubrobacter phytolaccae]MDA0181142.1 zinc metalloprotease [Solirubrobacter phytolaccae]
MSRTCATMVVHELLAETVPGYREARLEAEALTQRFVLEAVARTEPVTLQTVVHVVYRTDEENLSDAQIASQIDVLNRDFRARNEDRAQVPEPWAPLVADALVEFELVEVTRTKTDETSFGADDSVKALVPAQPDRLNVWVCTLGGGLLGYAQFPGGPAETDGVVVLNRAFGTVGTAEAPFDGGRTAVHEVGHWLGLRHIWGDINDCTGDDFVADTPPAQQANTGTPEWPHITCDNGPNGDMFMNYMDYVDDVAMFMFTAGQAARMSATLSGPRA